MERKTYQTVVLAGLLHDVGKALQRGDKSLSIAGKHPEISRSFINAYSDYFKEICDVMLLGELVQRHHEHYSFPKELQVKEAAEDIRPLAYLVSQADSLSAAERGEESPYYKDYKTQPLASVFSRLDIGKKNNKAVYYSMSELKPEKAFPFDSDRLDASVVNRHLRNMGEELGSVIKNYAKNGYDVFFTRILYCLEKYTWCMPSNTQEERPDVSLFDHLRTTAAIAATLYQYHAVTGDFDEKSIRNLKEQKFRLVVGDLSGIQNYIFGVSQTGAGGVAKRLRARSFYLTMLSEIISHKILEIFDLPLTNIIMSSGGKFYVLVPNTPSAESKILKLQNEIDEYSLKELGGEIVINLAQLAFDSKGFKEFGNILSQLAVKLAERKARPLLNRLVNEQGVWQEEQFVLNFEGNKELGLCEGCRKEFGKFVKGSEKTVLCTRCDNDLSMGSQLVRAKYIAFYRRYVPGAFRIMEGFYISLSSSEAIQPEPYLVISIGENIPNLEYPVLRRFYANYVPTAKEKVTYDTSSGIHTVQEGEVLSFDWLINEAKGKKELACLKADVDHLGSLFVFGFKEENTDFGTISRLSTLSRMLDVFFSGWVNDTIKKGFTNCYVVFSGGDDLMLIGPWNETINFANDLYQQFQCFTGNNPNITLSAGISFFRGKSPVATMAEKTETALEHAKETILPGNNEARNQFYAFGTTIKWDKVPFVIGEGEKLAGWLETGVVSNSFVRKLGEFSNEYQLFWKEKKSIGLRFLPHLCYEIVRNLKNASQKEAREWADKLTNLESDALKYLGFISQYALNLTRR